jgi:hypothetical protein
METVLVCVSLYASIRTKLSIMQTCKSCKHEFISSEFTNPVNYFHFKQGLKAFKQIKHARVRLNTWHRRLHSQDEPIIIF